VTRELGWDGCLNVRDLGGVPLDQGGVTRFGSLIRSDNVGQLTDRGWRSLADHGVTRIVDLRWPEELAEDAPRDVDLEVVHVSLLGELDPEFSDDIEQYIAADDPAGYWASAYRSMLDEYHANFGLALAAIADADEDRAVVFHCAAGKDRTGLVAALVLRLAGARIDEIAHDYSLTNEMLGRGPRAWVNEATTDREYRRRAFMQHTPSEAMRGALDHVELTYGGAARYLRGAGLTDAQIDRLRRRLVPA
jgi:protein-tyrosine phosphatase